MKVVFIGHTQSSAVLIDTILQNSKAKLCGIVSLIECNRSSDFVSLWPIAKKNHIPFLDFSPQKENELKSFILACDPDLIMCFGFNYLLSDEVIQLRKFEIWGYHPTKLPENRGRHPIIWALTLGLTETASTFFKIENGPADSGPVLSQKIISIDYDDNAQTLMDKLLKAAKIQLNQLINDWCDKKIQPLNQNHSLANSWRKRSKDDGVIDWRMSSKQIYDLTRALYHPYPGAIIKYKKKEITVWEVEELNNSGELSNIEPGKILEIQSRCPVIKCATGAIKLKKFEYEGEFNIGDYLK